MVKRFVFGNPMDTNAVVSKCDVCRESLPYFDEADGSFSLAMDERDIVYGLGENVRGINKRGFVYESFCTDDDEHNEGKSSLYGAHNFIILSGASRVFGAFFDTPGKVVFDVGYTDNAVLRVTPGTGDFELYIIDGRDETDIVKQFRTLTGQSYIPPRWAFGIGQSRWGYASEKDARDIVEGYKAAGLPLDMLYLDIDYMDSYKDFTVNTKAFPDFKAFAASLKEEGVRLVPIIDAAVKVEKGYSVYEEGTEKGCFCTDKDGRDFVVGVWPGESCLPDFLNSDARNWFGMKYKVLCDMGIEGFWNDMNEPALFYSKKSLEDAIGKIAALKGKNLSLNETFFLRAAAGELANNADDYKSFYHNADGRRVRHWDVHNLYGFNMTRAASEAFEKIRPGKRTLLFARASYIGAHRYGGIWMGDNCSRWAHLLMNLQMLPSLNMCGFLYTGADTGGFGEDTTEDLLLRWYALSIFTPLLRNHSSQGTRPQEPFRFKGREKDFAGILALRYRLLPYIYSEFMKAALSGGMYATPLGFIWRDDEDARHCEDQLMIGESIMIAPVYTQNAVGRHIYLPEDMLLVRFKGADVAEKAVLKRGHTFVRIAQDEVIIFIRQHHILPLAKKAENVESVDADDLELLHFGERGDSYMLYNDDGISRECSLEGNLRKIVL